VVEEESAGERIIEQTAPLREIRSRRRFPCPDLAPGQYRIGVRLIDAEAGKTVDGAVRLARPATPWVAAEAGIDETVPPPWTPLTAGPGTVRVWGREYHLSDGPFPERITTQGEPILASPVRVHLTTAAGEESFAVEKGAECIETKPTHVVFAGASTSRSLRLVWTSRIEFDGMLRCDLRFEPLGAPVEVRRLALSISAPAEHAKFVLTPCLRPWQDDRVELAFDHFVWLTGHRLGLCWFTESDANWVNGPDEKPIAATRDDSAATLTLNLITRSTLVDKPVPYTMGIQATPARPLPEGWRNLNLGGYGRVKHAKAQTLCWGGGSLKQNAYLQVAEEEAFRKTLRKYRDAGAAGCPYSCPTYMASHNSIYDFYQAEWRNSEGHKYVGYVKDALKYDLVAICPRSRYTDLLAWWVDELAKRFEIGGIYFDCCWPMECHNSYHGCGGRDAFGKRIRSAPIFPLRESLKRIYSILHKRDLILINHAHSRFMPPCHSFSDYWFPGEEYTAKLGRNVYYYTDDMPPEVWQSELNSAIKGVGISFLPEYGRGTPAELRDEQTKPSRSLLACCVVNDVPCSASWINLGEIEKLWAVMDKFSVSEAEFIPYWRPGPITADEPLTASAYKGEKYVLLIVSNLTAKPASAIVRVDAAALGAPPGCRIVSEVSGRQLDCPPDRIRIELPERDYTIVSITW